MSIGYESTVGAGSLNNMLGGAAVSRRDSAVAAVKLWSIIQSLGATEEDQVAALSALTGWQDPANDPQVFWTTANYLYADAQFYYGQLPSPGQFDYDSALAGVRAGQ